jgi:fructose-bisphosphate aldolase class II
MTLREELLQAREEQRAIGHFNISDSTQCNAILAAAKRAQQPVVIGVSEGEGAFLGIEIAAGMVKAARERGARVYLNADHSYSLDRAKKCIDAGFDSVIIDGAKLSLDENIEMTRATVAYARGQEHEVLVEGELGYIGTSSKLLDKLPEGVAVTEATMTSPEELSRFIAETGVDLIAPAVGNVHGIVASGQPRLSISRIESLVQASVVPIVLHGGSGTTDEDFSAAVKAGIRMIHINTEIRLAYRQGIEKSLAADAKEVAPYRFLAGGYEAVEEVAYQRMMLFAGKVFGV